VQLKLDGLPKGVTLAAPLKPVAPEQAEFRIELRADPKTAPAPSTLTLTCTATIGGVAYSHPNVTAALRPAAKK
jgi:hypothetical protein